jgi:hypothetical protein
MRVISTREKPPLFVTEPGQAKIWPRCHRARHEYAAARLGHSHRRKIDTVRSAVQWAFKIIRRHAAPNASRERAETSKRSAAVGGLLDVDVSHQTGYGPGTSVTFLSTPVPWRARPQF